MLVGCSRAVSCGCASKKSEVEGIEEEIVERDCVLRKERVLNTPFRSSHHSVYYIIKSKWE